MAKKVDFKVNIAGFNEIRNSGGVQSLCLSKAEAIAARANAQTHGRFVADVRSGKTRCHAMVKPADGSDGDLAARDDKRKNILASARGW